MAWMKPPIPSDRSTEEFGEVLLAPRRARQRLMLAVAALLILVGVVPTVLALFGADRAATGVLGFIVVACWTPLALSSKLGFIQARAYFETGLRKRIARLLLPLTLALYPIFVGALWLLFR